LFTVRKIINLVDSRSGNFFEKGIEAQKTVISRWFGKITNENFEYILNNIDLSFSDMLRTDSKRKEIEKQVNDLVTKGFLPKDQFDIIVNSMLESSGDSKSVEQYSMSCDELFVQKKSENIEEYNNWINNFSFKLMQYDTLKYAKHQITLEDSIKRQLNLEFIDSANEIMDMNAKLGIRNMQVSCDIQIINCTYGYTRRVADPKNSNNKNSRLKLNAFDKTREGNLNLVYGSKLDTEGILFEISQRKIVEWLYKNELIKEEQLPDLEDDIAIKKWFAENIHGEKISTFGKVDDDEIITKYVFSLLHSMSHAFIKTAGEISGLSKDSLSEIIIVETASIFIYAQTGQAIPLGALSGMAESNYLFFIRQVFDESKTCVFDPICTERDDTACTACLVIPEISCNHFNTNLGRKYLYSIHDVESPKVGFWEM